MRQKNKHTLIFKNIFTIQLLIMSFFGFSQNGKVTYKILYNKDNGVTQECVKENLKNAENNSENMKYALYWNENGMKFILENSKKISDEDYRTIQRICDIEGIFYKKKDNDEVFREIERTSDYESVVCIRKHYTNWKLSDEKKIIAGYECKKAECIYGIDYGDGEINYTYPLTAWYCPKIKNNYGPKGIANLPGLILELKQVFVTFSAIKIDLTSEYTTVSFPENCKIIKEINLTNYIKNTSTRQ